MTTTSQIREEAQKDPEVLQREIDAARADVGDTLEALQARLSPGQLLDEALGYFKGHSTDMARNVGNTIKQNPMPVILAAGIGLAWLIASRRSASREGWYEVGSERNDYDMEEYGTEDYDLDTTSGPGLRERLAARASSARGRLSGVRERLSSRVSATTSSLSEGVGQVRERARDRAGQARERVTNVAQEQPLLLGVVGIAVGALLGAALPTTRKEDELLGPARDRALEQAKSLGSQQYERARETLRQATEGAKQAVSGSQQSGASGTQSGTQPSLGGEGSTPPAF